jgi:hypothetical protein
MREHPPRAQTLFPSFTLRFACPDSPGAVSRPPTELAIARTGGTIQDANHSNDAAGNRLFTFGGLRATAERAARFRKDNLA